MAEKIVVSFLQDTCSEQGERKKKGEQEVFLPLLVQSCMNPEKKTLYSVHIEETVEDGVEYICFSVYGRREKYRRKDVAVSHEEYYPEIGKRGCIPCRNCGRC